MCLSATETQTFKLSTTLASNQSLLPLWVEEAMLPIMSKQSLWDNAWKHFNCKHPEQHLADAMKAMSAGTLLRPGKFGGKTIETAKKQLPIPRPDPQILRVLVKFSVHVCPCTRANSMTRTPTNRLKSDAGTEVGPRRKNKRNTLARALHQSPKNLVAIRMKHGSH
eukprot:1557555-Amphidinium_carterae.1